MQQIAQRPIPAPGYRGEQSNEDAEPLDLIGEAIGDACAFGRPARLR